MQDADISSGSAFILKRDVAVDLNKTGYLYVDTTGIDGGYTLFVTDGQTFHIRIISDTAFKGQYICDIKDMTGWQACTNSPLSFAISIKRGCLY